MRVKEGGSTTSEMGKKKKNKVTDYHNTSDEETQKSKGCPHKDNSVNFSGVKKGIKNCAHPLGTCSLCQSSSKKSAAAAEDDSNESPYEPTVWICLQCGSQLLLFACVSITAYFRSKWSEWCYKCDDEVPSGGGKKLAECAEWLKKQMGVKSETAPGGFSSKKKGKDKDFEKEEGGRNKMTPSTTDKNSPKVKGLVNLGNTCFFNAVMQNLTQTHILRSVLSEKWVQGKQVDIPLDTNLDLGPHNEDDKGDEDIEDNSHLLITLPSMGALTSALLSFLEDMNKDSKNSSVNPRPLFSEVCQKAARFKGYQQQDSHELLRYLLDSMKNEQIKRTQEGILHSFNLKDREKDKAKLNKLDESIKKKIRDFGLKSKMTFVDGVFGGFLISSVKCQVCNTVSEILEPFLDLSLPILEAKGSKKGFPGGKNPERPQTLVEQAKLAEPESDDLPSPGATAAVATQKVSKHQQQKAREKARKDAKKRNRKSRSLSQGSEKGEPDKVEERDSQSQSENEDGRDPNDADSETSMMERNGGNQNDNKTVTEDTVESRNPSDKVTSETIATTSDISEKNSATPESPTRTVNEGPAKKDSDDPKLKGGANTDHRCSEEEKEAEEMEEEEEVSSPKNSSLETERKNELQGENAISEINSGLSILSVNSTPPTTNGDSQDSRVREGDGEEETKTAEAEPEAVQLNGIPKQESKEDGDLTPTNVNSLSPAVNRKSKKPPPLIAPPPLPVSVQSKLSPPLSPLSPNIKAKATSPLGPRYQAKSQECSVESCLSQFTSPEWLTGANKFGCEHCTAKRGKDADGKSKTQYTDASKQLLIQHPPPILTLHLKRFQQVGYSLRKITRHIEFPLVLDLSPFCSESCQKFSNKDGQVLYALYGIVEHSGRLQFGHYTSFIKVRQPSQMLYLHTMKIPRGLNLLQASSSIGKKPHGADKRRHPKNNSPSVSESNVALHSQQPNGVLPTAGEHVGETDSQSPHIGNIPENGSGGLGQFPLASGEKEANPKGKWYYISDTHVSEVSESKVLNAQAYLLFYERIL
ncbi:putative ubiquitin carboxyl-terminal hydrolase 16 [Apostichopus japonicus]|uniref:Putative ubiquitin carboxyl-terminal hydrolase 16 n=1 Tax=Stichopus japonicus TaxID=307972 RepID=A0A2G8JKW3_STIJA|nr:putative ubiquitin carboxyl-terminal hydrolase 16 [Apostichopus japonicus]